MRESGSTKLTNEDRADLGVFGVEVRALRTGTWDTMPAVVSIEDALNYVAHACDRFGLHPPTVFRDAIRSYFDDFKDGEPRAQMRHDGERVTLAGASVDEFLAECDPACPA